MKILVTGATGYIGTAVAEALARAGHDIVALVQGDRSANRARAAGHAVAYGSLAEPGTVAAAACGVDAVVWTATTNDGAIDRPAIEATLGALGAGAAFLYTSGVWVHGDTGGAIVDESAALAPTPMVAWRAEVEQRVLSLGLAAGVRAVIVRPGIVYGRGGGIPAMLVDRARRDGVVRMPGDGANRWPLVHVDDLADLYVRALDRAAPGAVLIAASGSATQREVAEAASRAGGAGGVTAPWPVAEARTALGLFADALALDQRVSSVRAGALGWEPSRPDALTELARGSYAR